jgi:hypothetical protein
MGTVLGDRQSTGAPTSETPNLTRKAKLDRVNDAALARSIRARNREGLFTKSMSSLRMPRISSMWAFSSLIT